MEPLHLNTEGTVWDLVEGSAYLGSVLIHGQEEAEVVLVIVHVVEDISPMVVLLCDVDGSGVYGAHATQVSMGPGVIFGMDLDIFGRDVMALLIHDGEGNVVSPDIEFITVRDRGDGSG